MLRRVAARDLIPFDVTVPICSHFASAAASIQADSSGDLVQLVPLCNVHLRQFINSLAALCPHKDTNQPRSVSTRAAPHPCGFSSDHGLSFLNLIASHRRGEILNLFIFPLRQLKNVTLYSRPYSLTRFEASWARLHAHLSPFPSVAFGFRCTYLQVIQSWGFYRAFLPTSRQSQTHFHWTTLAPSTLKSDVGF